MDVTVFPLIEARSLMHAGGQTSFVPNDDNDNGDVNCKSIGLLVDTSRKAAGEDA